MNNHTAELLNRENDAVAHTMLDFPRLLVVTGCIPGNDGVGAILQSQILSVVPRELLRIVTISPKGTSSNRTDNNPWVDVNLTRRYEHAYRPVKGIVGELMSWVAHQSLYRPLFIKLVEACVRQGTQHQCEAVFAVLESPTAIFIAEQVAKKLNVPLYCFVMDGPNIHTRDFGFGRILTAKLLKSFDSAMRTAERIAVAGEAMQNAYQQRYNKKAYILRQGMAYQSNSPNPCRTDSSRLIIGFAGSLSARDAFDALLAELDQRMWLLAGRKVTIRVIGTHIRLTPTGPQHIEYFGWRAIPDMIDLLHSCDFLYMPQPFNDRDREFAELSFPNKLCTYVPASRPIMLHAPPCASLQSFFQQYPCGPQSSTLGASELLNQVEAAVKDVNINVAYTDAVDRAFREELNDEQLRHQVRLFLQKS